jgi:glucan endo-1,3-alpha-glucosidase
MGNTYPYNYNTWQSDIALASANGVDGFILNLGPDSWQPARVADAYNAAQNSGKGFKVGCLWLQGTHPQIMLSFDMAEFSCYDWQNAPLFKSYLDKYIFHPAAAKVNGKTAVTTFSGSDCTFGQGNANNGWAAVFGSYKDQIYFMPAYNTDPTRLGSFDIAAEVNWGSAWPSNGQDIEMSRDQWFMQQLNPSGKKYVGTLSPGFFTHFSYKVSSSKIAQAKCQNWIWRSDNWLFAQRWEQLISMRAAIDQIEIISWNDYGESSYVNPITGDMPPEAKLYATSGCK